MRVNLEVDFKGNTIQELKVTTWASLDFLVIHDNIFNALLFKTDLEGWFIWRFALNPVSLLE